MKCSNCQKELEENAQFCNDCGTPVVAEDTVLPEAVEVPAEEVPAVEVPAEEIPVAEVPAVEAPVAEAPAKKKINKKTLILGGIILGVVALIVAAVLIVFAVLDTGANGELSNDPLYVKDGNLYYSDFSKSEPQKLSKTFYAESAYSMTYNEKGSRLFFPDDERTLYYKDLNKDDKAQKVAKEVRYYQINPAGSKVLYLTTEWELYISDLKDEEKIDKDVTYFYATEDLKRVVYLSDGDLCVYEKGESEKLAKDVTVIEQINDERTDVYFRNEDGALCRYTKEGGEQELIEEVGNTWKIYESGKLYYTMPETVEYSVYDFVDDDMEANDMTITYPADPVLPTAPTRPQYPYSWNYTSDEEYAAAYAQYEADYAQYAIDYEQYEQEVDKAWEEFYAAVEVFNAAQERMSMREYLRSETFTVERYALYYFDGQEVTKVTDKMIGEYATDSAYDAEMAVVAIAEGDSVEPIVKMSELSYGDHYDLYWQCMDQSYGLEASYLLSNGQLTRIGEGEGYAGNLNDDGTAVYYAVASGTEEAQIEVVAGSSNNAGAMEAPAASNGDEAAADDVYHMEVFDLYKAEIVDGVLQPASQVDSGVWTYDVYGEDLITYKNGKVVRSNGSEYTVIGLYINGEQAASDFCMDQHYLTSFNGGYLFYTEYDFEKSESTLNFYKEGNVEAIAEGVTYFRLCGEETLFFNCDRSQKNGTYTVVKYENGKTTEMAEDVYRYTINADNNVVFLTDYDEEKMEGTLCVSKNGKVQEIDDDVYTLVVVYDGYFKSV